MTSPIDNEALPPSGDATKLPALGTAEPTDAFLSKVKEILEVLLGRRGTAQWDRAVTFRDLYGISDLPASLGYRLGGGGFSTAAPQLGMPSDIYQGFVDEVEKTIRASQLFKNLTARIGSIDDLAIFPDEIRNQLETALAQVARERGADIVTVERKIQTNALSFASKIEDITASLGDLDSGVRHYSAAFADSTTALATDITQVTARINNVDGVGSGVTVEEKFIAQADINTGLLGQWSIKIVAGTDANPVIAGFGLSVESPTEGPSTSEFVVLADVFALFTGGGAFNPFSVAGSTVSINGSLRVNGGTALEDIGASTTLIVTASSQVFQVPKTGSPTPSTITITAQSHGLSGSPVFTLIQFDGSSSTLAGSGDTRSIVYSDMTGDIVKISVSQGGLSDITSIVKVREGIDSLIAFLTNEAQNIPVNSTGGSPNFTGAVTSMIVYKGTVVDTSNWTFTKVDGTGITSTISGNTVTITGLTVDASYVDITAARSGFTSIVKRFTVVKAYAGTSGTNGTPGVRGTITIVASGSAWSDSAAAAAVAAAGYGSPVNRDIVTITNGSTFSQTKFYDTGSWLILTAYINGNLLVTGTVSADTISGGTITGSAINIGSGNFQVDAGTGLAQIFGAILARCSTSNGSLPAAAALTSSSSGSGPAITLSGGASGNAINITGGANGIVQTGGGANYLNTLNPATDNSYALGTSGSLRWTALYATSSTITTSDVRSKTDIADTDLGLDFIDLLRPVKYKHKVGENVISRPKRDPVDGDEADEETIVATPRPGERDHYGLISQEVREAMLACGVDDAAFWVLSDAADPDSQQALRYEELISPLIAAIQDLSARDREKEARITYLEHRLDALLSRG